MVNATSGGGSLIINTGANAIVNLGLLEASAGGVLDVHSNVTNAGGTIAGNGGIVELDVVTVSGGVITTTPGGTVDVAGSATLDGVVSLAVTIAAGAQLSVGGKDTLTLKGTIVDAGVLSVTGTSSASANAELLVSGTVALTGGGTVSLQDANGTSLNTQIVIGTTSSDVLDNVIGTISGYGRLGAGLMTLKNEAAGIIDAMFGTLAVYTGTNSIANAGLLEATTGVLDLRSNVSNVGVKRTDRRGRGRHNGTRPDHRDRRLLHVGDRWQRRRGQHRDAGRHDQRHHADEQRAAWRWRRRYADAEGLHRRPGSAECSRQRRFRGQAAGFRSGRSVGDRDRGTVE